MSAALVRERGQDETARLVETDRKATVTPITTLLDRVQ